MMVSPLPPKLLLAAWRVVDAPPEARWDEHDRALARAAIEEYEAAVESRPRRSWLSVGADRPPEGRWPARRAFVLALDAARKDALTRGGLAAERALLLDLGCTHDDLRRWVRAGALVHGGAART